MTVDTVSLDSIISQKMSFIYNALEDGWEVKKKGDNYVFKKRHHNNREVFLDSYLEQFLRKNLDVSSMITKPSVAITCQDE
jgi:hypothetical protein